MNNVRFLLYKNRYFTCLFFLFCCLSLCFIDKEGNAEPRLSPQTAPPKLIGKEFYSPFNDPDRKSFESIKRRLIGSYGEYRKSYKPGHLHAGIDLKGSFNEIIYAIGCGQIHLIFRDFPHQTVIVKHHLKAGGLLFSVYTHIEQVKVSIGEWVDERTPLARLFNEDELNQANFGTPNHLHLEIRKSVADEGRASYTSMTRQNLNKFCKDPIEFFKTYLEE